MKDILNLTIKMGILFKIINRSKYTKLTSKIINEH